MTRIKSREDDVATYCKCCENDDDCKAQLGHDGPGNTSSATLSAKPPALESELISFSPWEPAINITCVSLFQHALSLSLSLSLSLYVSVCVSLSLCASVSVCVSLCLSLSLSLSLTHSLPLSLPPSLSFPFLPSLSLPPLSLLFTLLYHVSFCSLLKLPCLLFEGQVHGAHPQAV